MGTTQGRQRRPWELVGESLAALATLPKRERDQNLVHETHPKTAKAATVLPAPRVESWELRAAVQDAGRG